DTTTRNFLPLPARHERGEGHSIKVASSPQPSPPVGRRGRTAGANDERNRSALVRSKFALEFHRPGKAFQVSLPSNRNGAQLTRDGRQQLNVEQAKAPLMQMPVQM